MLQSLRDLIIEKKNFFSQLVEQTKFLALEHLAISEFRIIGKFMKFTSRVAYFYCNDNTQLYQS